jgi:predicted hotdog family 3-hydroxylacyl-ACP dehydratase
MGIFEKINVTDGSMHLIDIDILTLLPQRPPFILIDNLIHYDEKRLRTEFTPGEENIFCSNGRLLPPGIIENIAQTCAARIGYISMINSKEISIGFLGSVQNLEIFSLPFTGSKIETEITVSDIVLSFTLVEARVMQGGNLIATCRMKIALIDEKNEKK